MSGNENLNELADFSAARAGLRERGEMHSKGFRGLLLDGGPAEFVKLDIVQYSNRTCPEFQALSLGAGRANRHFESRNISVLVCLHW
jgi:hypothetical protein